MLYTSRGVGNAALTTGIIGTAGAGLGVLNALMGNRGYNADPDSQPITRREANYLQQLSQKDSQIAQLQARAYTDQAIAQQAVINSQTSGNLGILQSQVSQLMGMTKTAIPEANILYPTGNLTATLSLNNDSTTTTS